MNSDNLSREAAVVPAPSEDHGPQLGLMLWKLLGAANFAGCVLWEARNHTQRHLQFACYLALVGVKKIFLGSGWVVISE